MAMDWGAVIQAANDMMIATGNWISQGITNKKNREFAKDMAGYENSVNRSNWLAENAYNTPAMQIQRLKAAGLNPALSMSQNQDLELAGSNMHPAAPVNASPQVAPQLHVNTGLLSELDLARAEAFKAESEGKEALSRIPGHEKEVVERDQNIANLKKQYDLLDKQVGQIAANTDLLKSEKALKDAQSFATSMTALTTFLNGLSERSLNEKKSKQIDALVNESNANAAKLFADADLIKQTARKIEAEVKRGNAEFRSKYGSTEAEIEATIKKSFDVATLELDRLVKSKKWQSSTQYQKLQMVQDIMNVYLEPVRAVSGMASQIIQAAR